MPVAAVVVAWVPLVLGLDSISGRAGQLLLGLLSWVLLGVLLSRQNPLTRTSVLIVVAYATLIEYTFSALLGTYTYRLPGVPAFVPPGHGLVYLAALCLGRSQLFRAHRRFAVTAAMLAVTAYALWGLLLSPRLDVLGAVWAACLLWFLWRGRAPLVYVGAFLVVTYLEILGTSIGTWTWGSHDPVLGWIAIGNPPSGAAGGYGFFDAAALALAPRVLALVRRLRTAVTAPAPAELAEVAEFGEAA